MKQDPPQRDFSMFKFVCEEKGNKGGNMNGIHDLLIMSRVKVRGHDHFLPIPLC